MRRALGGRGAPTAGRRGGWPGPPPSVPASTRAQGGALLNLPSAYALVPVHHVPGLPSTRAATLHEAGLPASDLNPGPIPALSHRALAAHDQRHNHFIRKCLHILYHHILLI